VSLYVYTNTHTHQVIQDICNSPAIGIMVDESTDLGTEEHLIMYATYLKDGVMQTNFDKLILLTACDASSITARICGYLDFKGIPMERLLGFGSDGSPVMVGKENGVAAMLKLHANPYILCYGLHSTPRGQVMLQL
jgi:hypothetical protein